MLTEAQKAKTHIFSTFFYNTLTNTKLLGPSSTDVKLTAPQKRHERVKNWTKHVNIFEKDFIIVPINQQSHWFLAIICFPTLKGPVTIDSNQPVKPTPVAKKKPPAERKESVALQIGNTTITPVSKKDIDSICVDEESERDEAEGEESDLESDDSEPETAEPQPTSHPIKQYVNCTENNGIKMFELVENLFQIFPSSFAGHAFWCLIHWREHQGIVWWQHFVII